MLSGSGYAAQGVSPAFGVLDVAWLSGLLVMFLSLGLFRVRSALGLEHSTENSYDRIGPQKPEHLQGAARRHNTVDIELWPRKSA